MGKLSKITHASSNQGGMHVWRPAYQFESIALSWPQVSGPISVPEVSPSPRAMAKIKFQDDSCIVAVDPTTDRLTPTWEGSRTFVVSNSSSYDDCIQF